MMMKLLLVVAGGAVGSGLRWGVGVWLTPQGGIEAGGFPWATFLVNAIGCAAAGAVWTMASGSSPVLGEHQRVLLLSGFLGGFTTFSAFGVEAIVLQQGGHGLRAMLYVGASVVVGLLGAWGGMQVGTWMIPRPGL